MDEEIEYLINHYGMTNILKTLISSIDRANEREKTIFWSQIRLFS